MKKDNLKVLVVGSGGREHAIVDAIARSPRVAKIFCAPGNKGIAAKAECVPLSVTDVDSLAAFAKEQEVDLTVVGPEAALAAGIADKFHAQGLKIFGPTKNAARIESSKEYAKQIMLRHGIPTGGYEVFDSFGPAWDFVKSRPLPAVIKYDGLAAGKGVVVATSYEEAEAALRDMLLDSAFGHGRVIVEEFLEGPEFSFMCVVGGDKVYPLELAQDHKRAYDGDQGPNTGGMGAYSPVPFISEEVRREAFEKVMVPTAKALVEEGNSFTGILYGGLILTKDGPKVIEFNARFGDPETEVVLPRLESDIVTLFEAALEGKDYEFRWSPNSCLGVVMASEGYPGSYTKGAVIEGLDHVKGTVYHMGTAENAGGKTVTAGGRVLMVVGEGKDLKEANANALADVECIGCDTLFHRTDIGKAALK